VELYEVRRLDFADVYLVVTAERSGVRQIVSFDCAIDRVGTVRRVEPEGLCMNSRPSIDSR
jgi:predicted nucleic acid-binding protein